MHIQKLTKESDVMIKAAIVAALIIFALAYRLAPHPANFAPIGAIAIFGGALLPQRWALSLPLAAMVLSDLFLGLHPLIGFTWGSFLLIALFSGRYIKKVSPAIVGGASLGASVLFFVITNFGVWLEGRMYAPTIEGLASSYINALPFFRNTLLSDLVFSTVLFSAYVLVYRYVLRGQGSLQVSSHQSA